MTEEMKQYIAFAERLADAASKETLPRFRKGAQVFNKAGIWFDPVTDADREGERAQRRLIEAAFPKHGIIGEEFGKLREDADLRWVLDPVDGTRAFVCGVASWATLIALEKHGEPILGLIDQPFTQERWIGAEGRTIYRHGAAKTDATSSGVTKISKARLSTTDPRKTAYFTSDEAAAFERVAAKAQVCRFSLDAYAYALLAIGELDLVIESGLKHHDFAALVPVVRAAGGVITNWRGEALGSDDRGAVVAAATPDLHAAALEALGV
jgi:myo-inositol-1(or 4)-monophosphatase